MSPFPVLGEGAFSLFGMEHLIEYVDYQVRVNPELLLVRPFRALFNADKTRLKEKFMTQLSVVYFLVDPRSTYAYMSDEGERLAAIIEQEGLPSDFKVEGKLLECVEAYRKHVVTKSSLLLEDSLVAIDKVRAFLRGFSLDDLEEKDRFSALKSLTSTIQLIPKLVTDLQEAQEKVSRELGDKGRARGQARLKVFEDGFGG